MQLKDYKLYNKSKEDLEEQIRTLSRAYTPEWDFQTEHPDAGSVIGMIFAGQMARNIENYNSSLMRQHINLINLLGLTLTKAAPSQGFVTMELVNNSTEGVRILPGTRLLGQKEDGDEGDLVFETQEEIYVTESRLTHVLGISGTQGKIIPYWGEVDIPELTSDVLRTESFHIKEFRLFDFGDPGISQAGILLYHKAFLSMGKTKLYLRFFGDNDSLPWEQVFGNPKSYQFCYLGEQGMVPVKNVIWEQDSACLEIEETPGKTRYGGEEYGLLYIKAMTQPKTEVYLNQIMFSSSGGSREPEFLCRNGKELDGLEVFPFGRKIELYDEFYIGSDFIFSQMESSIQIEFDLSFREELVSYGPSEEFELKPIKKVPKNIITYQQYETQADQVTIEYFNGMGWKPVKELFAYQDIFKRKQNGHMVLTFSCPAKWSSLELGAYYGRVLRFQINKAPNCYMTPCLHLVPVLHHIRLSYSYEGILKKPERIRVVQGTQAEEVPKRLLAAKPFLAAGPLPYEGDGVYLGFDKKMVKGPVSLFFQIEGGREGNGAEVQYEYSSRKGFLPLKTSDNTDGLSHSQTVTFLPPFDFSAMEIEGISRYWLRIRRIGDFSTKGYPNIRNILPNTAAIQNRKTEPEESFYIDSGIPDMKFELGAGSLLHTYVYVNERNSLSKESMEELIQKSPHRVKADRDAQGEIIRFFVLWDEVPNFNRSSPDDRHYVLDRTNNFLLFGDGLHGKIPSECSQAAFTVTPCYCSGEAGNVSGGSISRFESNPLFIKDIRNPVGTYGGCNMENLAAALKRGANLLSGRNRLVSRDDYIREVKAFSDRIGHVSCMMEKNRLILILLLKDFDKGRNSFHSLKEPLKQRIIKLGELTYGADEIVIREPLYVKINVEAWVDVKKTEKVFEIQDKLLNAIDSFLHPFTPNQNRESPIGILPKEGQISMMLHSIKNTGILRNLLVTAAYEDENGFHESGLDDISCQPYMIGINGEHKIHMEIG